MHLPRVIKVMKNVLRAGDVHYLKPTTKIHRHTNLNPSSPGLAGFGTLDAPKVDDSRKPIFVHRLASETSEYGLR